MKTRRSGSRSPWLSNQAGPARLHGQSFFARHAAAHEEAVKPGHRDMQASLDQRQAQLFQRDVLACLPDCEDVGLPLLDPARPHITTLSLGREVASFAALPLPADRCRWGDAEPDRRRPAAHPVINRRHKP
jgi:hypothetical protein